MRSFVNDKITRGLVLFCLMLLFAFPASSNGVTKNEALNIALAWLNSFDSHDNFISDIDNVYVREKQSDTLFYVIGFTHGAWVMVAGNHRVEPVLAYSRSSQFKPDEIPVQLDEWMWGLEQEIEYANKNSIIPGDDLTHKWEQLRTHTFEQAPLKSSHANVSPLLSTRWSQGRYFNEIAPPDASSSTGNGHVWIGCVATAMAQIMKFWEYPIAGMGYHSYTQHPYGTLSADFENTTYNWSAMPNVLNAGNTEVQKISYHSAISVDMQFGPYYSGAYLDASLQAMTDYFRYNSSIFYVQKDRWDSEEEWKQLLRDELGKGRPVIYAGYNQNGSSGHAFVCDGYDGEYFHFNWGWGGYADGNYLLSALQPGAANYSSNQSALMGIEPVLPIPVSTPWVEGFETATSDFSLSGVASPTSGDSHSGDRSLQLSKPSFSSYSLNSATFSFLVPANGFLSFWVKRKTPDASVFNKQKAVLKTLHGSTILINFFNGDFNDEQWVNYTADLSPYAGQIVRLIFQQQNFDNYREQWMFIDDVVLTGENQNLAPYEPKALAPLHNATSVSFSPLLEWAGGDSNGDSLTYHVHFGSAPEPPFLATVSEKKMDISNLEHSKTYYWRVVADDGNLQTPGPVWSFTTRGIPPDVNTCGLMEVTSNSAQLCGRIVSDNGNPVTGKGIAWSNVPFTDNPSNIVWNDNETHDGDVFYSLIENLQPYTNYYARAVAMNSEGTGYGEQFMFRTEADIPLVSVAIELDVKRTSATIVCNIQRLNDSLVVEKGIVWDLSSGFDVALAQWHFVDGSVGNISDFTAYLSKLPGPDTLWYRAFATNSAGTAFSEEKSLILTNNIPAINLDADNSSGSMGNHYHAYAVEFLPGGNIADTDIYIADEDGDTIQSVRFILKNQVYNEDEFLVYTGNSTSIKIEGNGTRHLQMEKAGDLCNTGWEEIIRQVEYRIEHNAPSAEIVREVHVSVSDGFDWSSDAIAFISVIPVNDPPVCQSLPSLSESPVFGGEVQVVPGLWIDELDQCEGEMSFEYWWQIKSNDEIMDSLAMGMTALLIDESFCGKQLRLVEKVYDSHCGGANVATSIAKSEWYSVEKANQTVTFDLIPPQQYSTKPYTLKAYSSSGLPLIYRTPASQIIEIDGDQVYMKTTGNAPISTQQPGNACYNESALQYRILVIEQGSQEILYNTQHVGNMSQKWTTFQIESTSGLPVNVAVSDSNLASFNNDTLFFHAPGVIEITLTQPGNDYIYAADTIHFSFEIVQGIQHVEIDYELQYPFRNQAYEFDVELSSGLIPVVQSSDSAVFIVENNNLIPRNVGLAYIEVSHPGDEFYEALQLQSYPVEISKGHQYFHVADSLNVAMHDKFLPINSETTAGLSLNFEIENTEIVTYSDNGFDLLNAGSTRVTALQAGNSLYNSFSQTFFIQVRKGVQFVEIEEIPALVYGQDSVVIKIEVNSGLPVSIQSLSEEVIFVHDFILHVLGAGNATLLFSQDGNNNWNAWSHNVNIEVEKASQHLFTLLPDTLSEGPFEAEFYSSSGLEMSSLTSSDEEILLIVGDSLVVKGNGSVQIEARQNGNENYWPANHTFSFHAEKLTRLEQFDNLNVSIFPNPVSDLMHLSLEGDVDFPLNVSIVSVLGELILQEDINKTFSIFNVSHFRKGVYFVVIRSDKFYTIHKITIR